MLIASAKSRSARGASHQPAFMSGCLTISHTCLPCLPGKIAILNVAILEVSTSCLEEAELGKGGEW